MLVKANLFGVELYQLITCCNNWNRKFTEDNHANSNIFDFFRVFLVGMLG
mgnify:CR=1 FL=1